MAHGIDCINAQKSPSRRVIPEMAFILFAGNSRIWRVEDLKDVISPGKAAFQV